MKKQRCNCAAVAAVLAAMAIGLAGCGTVGGAASDLGLAGAGGAIGYEVSDHRIGGAAAGAAAGYIASKVAQSEVKRSDTEAEKRGFDRALNQAVKQQYWIIQNQQRAPAGDSRPANQVPVQVPETTVNGVLRNATVAYVPIEP
ncbi:MAG: hypothetical protein HYV96_09270 [Opitutae bacterium]|nr:hypothetical protein [Opitutae bacterium]